jgi:hypothetical protein
LRARIKGGKLSGSREKRDEFLTTPRSCSSRGEPKAKLLGAFSLIRFFGASKEMNKDFLNPLDLGLNRYGKSNAADGCFSTACN